MLFVRSYDDTAFRITSFLEFIYRLAFEQTNANINRNVLPSVQQNMDNVEHQLTLFMSDFLNNALNASDCTASAVVTTAESRPYTNWKNGLERGRTAHVDFGPNVTEYALTLSVSKCFRISQGCMIPTGFRN
jgi:hypothetical protein